MNNKRQAFTLIEMLVVVAVIGILSSVLLTALGPARNKAKDARIIQEINQVRAYAETLYNGNYSALVEIEAPFGGGEDNPDIGDSILKELFDDMKDNGGRLVIKKLSNSQYLAYSQLNTTLPQDGNPEIQIKQYYCVDSVGRSTYTIDENHLLSGNNPLCP